MCEPGHGCRGGRAAAVGKPAFAESHAATARVWEWRRIYFAAAMEEIRPDGEFLDENQLEERGGEG